MKSQGKTRGVPNGDTLTNEQNIEDLPAQDERTSNTVHSTETQNSENVVTKRTRRRSSNQRQDNRNSSVQPASSQSNGYFSLVLILIFILCILILVFRRIYYMQ